MDIILIAGLWLEGSAWDAVAAELRVLGHRPVPLTLPGQGAGSSTATLADQVGAVLDAVACAAPQPLVVGHSAAASLAWLAADARPDAVSKVVLIGGMPVQDGRMYVDFLELTDGVLPFPGWEMFEGPDSADLDEPAKARIAARAIPVPGGVARGVVHLVDDRRYQVPVALICPEFGPADAQAWLDAGELPELAKAAHLELIDLESGHWPMFSAPRQLARILAGLADTV